MTRALALGLLLCAVPAAAANRCTQTATGTCASRHDTIQQAVDAAAVLDRVIVGAGLYVEDVLVVKKIHVTGQPGHQIDGEWHDLGNIGAREIRSLDARVRVTGGAGVKIINGDGCVVLDSTESARVQGRSVSGCAVGVDVVNAIKPYVATVTATGNGIGIRITGGASTGQYFYNVLRGNGIAVQVNDAYHTDINSNDVFCDAVAGCIGFQMNVVGAAVNDTMEYNQNEFFGFTGAHWAIQRCDGTYTNDPVLSPEKNAQYGTNHADGEALPIYNTSPTNGCPV